MGIKRTLLKAGFITMGAALGITGAVYTLDKFEESYRKNETCETLDTEEVEQVSLDKEE